MNLESATIKLHGLLDIKRKAVGIKLVNSEEEYEDYSATELYNPLPYCVAVKCATAGKGIKMTGATSKCGGSTRALGLVEPAPTFLSGEHGHSLGLFKSESLAGQVAKSLPSCEPDTYGVIIKPLDQFKNDPDIVLVVADSRSIMRILQGYTYYYGIPEKMHMSGNQAVCVECTVTPLKSEGLNVSMLCSGTRHSARWHDTDCMVGIAFPRFFNTIRGIEQTINVVEPDKRKKIIEANLSSSDHLEIQIEYGKAYFKQKR